MKRKLIFEIKTLDNYIMRKVFNENKKCDFPAPSPVQLRTIAYLIEHIDDEVYQKDLEKEFNLRRSTISGILKTMEKHGIIIKINANNDARSKRIKLSEETMKKHYEMVKKHEELNEFLINDIDEKELEVFYKVIDKIKANIVR